MAIELEIQSATALVTGEVKEKKLYQGTGDQRREVGRLTDAEGRPLSGVAAVVVTEPLGLLGDAQIQLPDVQLAHVEAGMAIRLDGRLSVRLAGREYGVINAMITAERITPVGNYVEWTQAAVAGKKPAESRTAS